MNIKELKKLIKDLPDDMEVWEYHWVNSPDDSGYSEEQELYSGGVKEVEKYDYKTGKTTIIEAFVLSCV